MLRWVCRELWAWHSCPKSLRKNYKAIALEYAGLALTAIAFAATMFALVVIHNVLTYGG